MAGAPTEHTIQMVVKKGDQTKSTKGAYNVIPYSVILQGETTIREGYARADLYPDIQPGQKVTGWADSDGKIGFADPDFKPRGGGGSGGGQSNYERQPDHPLTVGQKLTTSTLSPVPAFIEQMLTLSLVDTPKTTEAYWTLVGRTVEKLKKFYPDDVIARAEGSTNGTNPQQEQAPAAAKSDDDIPF